MVLRGESRPEFLAPETLPEILAATATRLPSKNALLWEGRPTSYAQLHNIAQRIAASLAAQGVATGQVIGLLLPRGESLLLAQAGITSSGAAWLPFDSEIPFERAATCLRSANATALLTTKAWAERTAASPVPVWFLEDLLAENAPRKAPQKTAPQSPAYVIYTSGSTGTPKGIVITHANICHFLRSENAILGIHSEDLVYQGFSLAFDMSFEEIWISYLAGACLWIAPPETVSDPEALGLALNRERITVLHAVPTLAALLDHFPRHLRLINLGGEACPEALAQRLTGQGRRIFNTYGPTETTVSATLAELLPNRSVTIGKPLPNYAIAIVDPAQKPLPPGEIGEIAVFGPGVSPGYLNLPELTASRFLPNPLSESPGEAILYLTGDLGKITPDGEIHCLGRVDNQVKLRGFRIELDEIGATLCRHPQIATAAAVVREFRGEDAIVGYFVPQPENEPNEPEIRRFLIGNLPSYMVPAHIEKMERMPRLPSGKIDLGSLRNLPLTNATPEAAEYVTTTQTESALWNALSEIFPGRKFRPEDDFFCDLGGHSLLAAKLVTVLRRSPELAGASVQHIYRERTLGNICKALDQVQPANSETIAPHEKASLIRRFLCGCAQAVVLPFIILLQILQWLAPFFTYHFLTGSGGDSIAYAILCSIGTYLLSTAVSFPVEIGLRRIAAMGMKPGNYPLWGGRYFQWWICSKLSAITSTYLISGTPWTRYYYRLLGAKIGENTLINSITVAAPEFLTIGDHSTLGTFTNIENAKAEGGRFIIGPVTIGNHSTVDSYAVLEPDTKVGNQAHLCGQSALKSGQSIPENETWSGIPAKRIDPVQTRVAPAPTPSFANRMISLLFYALGASFIAVLFFIPTFPTFVLLDWIDTNTLDVFESSLEWWQTFPLFFLMAIPASMVLVMITGLIVGILRLPFPRQTPGQFSIHGWAYKYKWLLSTIFDTSLHTLYGLYASIYVGSWLRLMGAKVGKGAEVSTAEGITPELLQLGDDSFIADGVLLGDEEQHDGWMILKGTQIGNRSFIGNGAYVPDGANIPDDVLIGVQSATPANGMLHPNQTWLGSPALTLPARETVEIPDARLTFRPGIFRKIIRGTIEALRIVLPPSFIIAAGYVIIYKSIGYAEEGQWISCISALTLSGLAYGLCAFIFVLILKWGLIGRYNPRKAPMWTLFVWVSEAITVAYESLAVPALLDLLRGTPMLPWALRLLGVKIGKGAWINTTDMTEFDCVEIGDFAELNAHSGPQTHLFEDRIMRIGKVMIGANSTIGARTTVLYDASVGEGCRLGPLTLVAKGEHLPPNTRWEGTPANMSA